MTDRTRDPEETRQVRDWAGQPGQLERDDEIARIRWAKCKRVI